MENTVKKSSIYTKTGDSGVSSLYTGDRRSKSDRIFKCLGNLDELNSHLGYAGQECKNYSDISEMLRFLQCRIFDIGSIVATPRSLDPEKAEKLAFEMQNLNVIEEYIDRLDSALPKLMNFILPAGSEAATRIHLARAVCRRCERSLVKILEVGDFDEHAYKFLNRLSDLLFVMARTVMLREGTEEVIWTKH